MRRGNTDALTELLLKVSVIHLKEFVYSWAEFNSCCDYKVLPTESLSDALSLKLFVLYNFLELLYEITLALKFMTRLKLLRS